MKLAISQPTFLPWQGYFALINYVNEFVFLDNVQFNKRSWQQRNYIIINSKKNNITIPVKTKNKFFQKINEVEIDYNNFDTKKFLFKIETNYKRSPFFDEFYIVIKNEFLKEYKYLSDLNINLIKTISRSLNINTPFVKSSEVIKFSNKDKINFLLEILRNRKADSYITTLGSKEYLGNLIKFPNSDISIKYFEYKSTLHKQNSDEFQENLSIIDLIFNVGIDSRENLIKNLSVFN